MQKCRAISIIKIVSTQHFFGTCTVLSMVDNYGVRWVLRELTGKFPVGWEGQEKASQKKKM